MNPPKCDEMDYINFLIAAQQVFSSVEASQTHPAEEQAPAHDAYTRLLKRLPPDSQALWQEVNQNVSGLSNHHSWFNCVSSNSFGGLLGDRRFLCDDQRPDVALEISEFSMISEIWPYSSILT